MSECKKYIIFAVLSLNMLEFLKESTFKANDIISRALNILKKHYISVAGLCFLLFLIDTLNTFLLLFMESIEVSYSYFLRILIFLVIIVLFFGVHLVLIKRAVYLAQHTENTHIANYIPSVWQFISFIIGLLIYSVISMVTYLLTLVITFPLVYLEISFDKIWYEICPVLTGIIMLFVFVRTSFFPFFILDRDFGALRSFRMSLAFTKGNVVNLLTVCVVLALPYILRLLFESFGYSYLAMGLRLIHTFIIIPSVSLVLAIAYTDMIKEYKGSDDPELFKNII